MKMGSQMRDESRDSREGLERMMDACWSIICCMERT